MYWQVYLHKTVLSAENLLVNILKRAKELSAKGVKLFATPTLKLFLITDFTKEDLYHAVFDFQNRERRFGKTSEQISN
jgi:HD superfamily phosphohydrolase